MNHIFYIVAVAMFASIPTYAGVSRAKVAAYAKTKCNFAAATIVKREDPLVNLKQGELYSRYILCASNITYKQGTINEISGCAAVALNIDSNEMFPVYKLAIGNFDYGPYFLEKKCSGSVVQHILKNIPYDPVDKSHKGVWDSLVQYWSGDLEFDMIFDEFGIGTSLKKGRKMSPAENIKVKQNDQNQIPSKKGSTSSLKRQQEEAETEAMRQKAIQAYEASKQHQESR